VPLREKFGQCIWLIRGGSKGNSKDLQQSASKSPNAPKNAATTQHQVARADVARQQHTQDSTEKASKLKARMNLESPNERGNDARNSFLSFVDVNKVQHKSGVSLGSSVNRISKSVSQSKHIDFNTSIGLVT
jgi:hypothetical protein